jgi:hypothetical protein
MPRPSNTPLFDHPNDVLWRIQHTKPIMKSSRSLSFFLSLWSRHFPQRPEIWGYHGDCGSLGHDTVQYRRRLPTLRRNMLSPASLCPEGHNRNSRPISSSFNRRSFTRIQNKRYDYRSVYVYKTADGKAKDSESSTFSVHLLHSGASLPTRNKFLKYRTHCAHQLTLTILLEYWGSFHFF